MSERVSAGSMPTMPSGFLSCCRMANRLWLGTVNVPLGSYLSQTSRNSSSCSMVIFLVSEPTLAKFSRITPMASDMMMYAMIIWKERKISSAMYELPHDDVASPSTMGPHLSQQRSRLSPHSGPITSCMMPLNDSPVTQRAS
eukprot:3958900-Prymnesium_polylepis.1